MAGTADKLPALDRSDSFVESSVVKDYYLHTDFFTSTEGILKAFSIVICVVSSSLFLAGGACMDTGAGRLVQGGGALGFASTAALALLYAGLLLAVPVYMPLTWLVAPLTVINAGLVTGSAALSYRAVTRRWDERRARMDRARLPRAAPHEQEA